MRIQEVEPYLTNGRTQKQEEDVSPSKNCLTPLNSEQPDTQAIGLEGSIGIIHHAFHSASLNHTIREK